MQSPERNGMRETHSDWLIWIKCKLRALELMQIEGRQQENLIRMSLRLSERVNQLQ
jgi:hypothetical protein